MPDFFGYVVERRVAVNLGFRRLEHHALLGRVGRRDRARRNYPDRQALAAASEDVAGGLQRHGGVGRMQRAAMLVREPVAAANEDFPQRRVGFGHRNLQKFYSAACASCRCLRLSAKAAAASRTQAPSSYALRRAAIRSRLHGPLPASTSLNSVQSIGLAIQWPASSCFMAGSGIVSPRKWACGTVASMNFWRSSSLEKRLIFHLVEASPCWLALSGGPNIISTGHHQRSSASCAIAFCSALPRDKVSMISKPWRW